MMMKTEKRKIAWFIAAVVLLSVFVSSSCGKRAGEEVSETFAVTFVQDGFADETRVWKDGVIDVPTPKPVKGYDVGWDTTDFSSLDSDVTVRAIKAARNYTVTLDPCGGAFADTGLTDTASLSVTFDAGFTLPVAEKIHCKFLSWKTADGLTVDDATPWNIDEDITLYATFVEKDRKSVTFVQPGMEDIVIEVYDGEKLESIPTPQPIEGYDVCWDAEDIGNTIVTEAIVVNIRKTPKIYNAVFKVEGKTENKRIAYREKLAFPIIDDEAFICWQVENDAAKRFYGDEITYDYACDTTFIAVFRFVDVEIIVDGNYTLGGGFSPNLKIRYGAAFNEYLGYNFGNYAIAKYTYVMNGKTITITQSGKEVCRSDGKITLYATVEEWTDFY